MLFGFMYLNSAALPCTFMTSNAVHVPKTFQKKLDFKPSSSMLSSILCGSWDDRLSEALQPVQLDSSIILNEIIQFADAVEKNSLRNYKTAHSLWTEILPELSPEIPDYYLSEYSYNNIVSVLQ